MTIPQSLREKTRILKRDMLTLYFAAQDPRTPLLPKVLATLMAAYALSPIALIPDFVPVLGYVDDVIIVPLGIVLALRMISVEVIAASRSKA